MKSNTKALTHEKMVDKIFYSFGIVFGKFWNNRFKNNEDRDELKKIYFFVLKKYSHEEIESAISHMLTKFKFPPLPADMIEVLDEKRKEKNRFKKIEEKKEIKKHNPEIYEKYMAPLRKKFGIKKHEL